MRIYFSGPHGAGKSSLIEAACDSREDFTLYPDRLRFAKVDEPKARQRCKIAKFLQEHYDQEKFMKENPGKVMIGDRCVYDSFAYNNAFVRLGWMEREEKELHERIVKLWFPELPQHLIVVNPLLENLVEHLKKRWEKGKKKWREEDTNYLRAVHEEFQRIPDYFRGENLLMIEDELSIYEEMERFLQWYDGLKGEMPVLSESCSTI